MKLNEARVTELAAVLDAGSISAGAQSLSVRKIAVIRPLKMWKARIGKLLFVKGNARCSRRAVLGPYAKSCKAIARGKPTGRPCLHGY